MKTLGLRPTLLVMLATLLAGCARGGGTPTAQPSAARHQWRRGERGAGRAGARVAPVNR